MNNNENFAGFDLDSAVPENPDDVYEEPDNSHVGGHSRSTDGMGLDDLGSRGWLPSPSLFTPHPLPTYLRSSLPRTTACTYLKHTHARALTLSNLPMQPLLRPYCL